MKKFYRNSILAACLLAACTSISYSQTARVQVIHNSPDDIADSVDVYLNGMLLLDNFAFRTATPFIDAPAGVQIQIDVAPKTSTSVANSIANFPLTLTANETYIVVASGITGLSSTTYSNAPAFNLEIFASGREEASMMANTDVLVYHGSTDAPTVDVVETSVPAGTIVDDASYSDFAGYLELGTADYLLDVRDMSGATTVASYQAPLSTLALDGEAITVLASGFLDPSMNGNGPAFGLFVALASGGNLVPLPLATASLSEASMTSLAVYPNPANDLVTIETAATIERVEVVSLSGQSVLETNNSTINVSELTAGVYMILVKTNEGVSSTRLIKE